MVRSRPVCGANDSFDRDAPHHCGDSSSAQNDGFLLYEDFLLTVIFKGSGFVEDHGVEAVADEEACVLVELDGLVVRFGNG